MKIEIDSRIESAKFVVDGHELDVMSIEDNTSASFDSDQGLRVVVTFHPEELIWTDRSGVTITTKADGTITASGTDEQAVRRAVGLG